MKKHSRKQREIDHVSTTCGEPHPGKENVVVDS
ncbi:hypothetical protein QO003_002075 [Arthrobacter silviterrae]|nr:hypothetical protein [Arthrobacter silviterrae]